MTTLTARLSLLGSTLEGQEVNLEHLTGQEVDLWECRDAAVPLGVGTITGAVYDFSGDALVLTVRLSRLMCGDRTPPWLVDGETVDVSTRYEWAGPGLLRLHALAHTTPCRTEVPTP